MKKTNVDVTGNLENPQAQQISAESGKVKAKSVKVRKDKEKSVDGVRLPVLVEFAYTLSSILLIFLGLTMIGISFITGASLFNLVLRTSVAVLVIGTLLILISSHISSGVLNIRLVEQEESHKTQFEESENSVDIENHSTVEA